MCYNKLASPVTWFPGIFHFWDITCLIGLVMGVVLHLLVVIIICQNRMQQASLEISGICHEQNVRFETKQLGYISETELSITNTSITTTANWVI